MVYFTADHRRSDQRRTEADVKLEGRKTFIVGSTAEGISSSPTAIHHIAHDELIETGGENVKYGFAGAKGNDRFRCSAKKLKTKACHTGYNDQPQSFNSQTRLMSFTTSKVKTHIQSLLQPSSTASTLAMPQTTQIDHIPIALFELN